MTCHDYEEWLSAFYDGELERERVPELMTHLAECAACKSFLASVASIERAERSLKAATVPPGLDARIHRIVPRRERMIRRLRGASLAVWNRRFALPLPAIGAIAVVVLSAGLLLWHEAERPPVAASTPETQIIYVMEMPPVVVQGRANGNPN